MFLIVGLGNPGARYARTRHNAGFDVVARLADRAKAPAFREKFHGEFTRCEIAGEEALLLRPMTFMNESGRSVQAAMAFFRIPLEGLVVVHDELDLEFGQLRFKKGGGLAGHNGLKSIFACVGTAEFVRLRCGIGRPPAGFKGEIADYVLSDFGSEDRAEYPDVLDKASKALFDMARRGLAAATNALNVRPKKPKEEKVPDANGTNVDSSKDSLALNEERR